MRMTPARPLAPRMRATASRSVVGHDLQLDMHAFPGAHHAEEAADGVGDPTVTADPAAHVRLVDRERQLDLVPALRDGDRDAVGVVHQRASHVIEELCHAGGSSSVTASVVASAAALASASGAASVAASGAASSGAAWASGSSAGCALAAAG